MSRGYLWQNLPREVEGLFAQQHPLSMTESMGSEWKIPHGWAIVDGDAPRARQGIGLCRVCGSERDKRSKVYCGYHLLMSRQSERELAKREGWRPKKIVVEPLPLDKCPQHGHELMLDLTTKKQLLKVYFCPTRGCKHEVTR